MMKSLKIICVSFSVFFSVLSFSSESLAQTDSENVDPWESMNRKTSVFNNAADKYFLVPVAKGYNAVMPTPANEGVSNLIANTLEVNTILNSTFQLKPKNLGLSLSRFLINLTLGFFGFFDVASELGVYANKEDFGQTFAYWGAPQGPYIVLPILGPSSVRDGLGLYPDILVNPLITDNVRLRNTSFSVFFVDTRAELLNVEKLITGDRYVFLRNAYLQNREFLNNDGVVQDSFGDGVEEDDWLNDDF